MSNDDIWKDIEAKPNKKFKLTGDVLLSMRREYEDLKKNLEKEKETLGDLAGINDKLKFEIKKLKGEITVLKNDIETKDAEIEKLQKETAELESKLKQESTKSTNLEGKLNDSNADISQKDAKIGELEQKIESLQDRVVSLENDITSLEGEKAKLQQEVDDLLAPQRALTTPSMKDQNVRACNTCKQYVLMKEGEYKSMRAMQIFEGAHNGHMLATLDLSEVPKGYEDRTVEFVDKLK